IIDNKVKRCMYRCTLPTGGGVEKTPNIYNIDIDNIDNIYIDSDKSITEKNTLPSSTPDKASKKGTRLSENWQPNNEEIEYAKNKGLSQEEIETQCELFLNYWLAKSGSGAVKKDWKRTWFTWVLNYVNNYKRARRIAPQNRLQEVQNHNMEVLRQLHKQDNNNSQLPIRTVFDF
ncbi:MAG: hypothetical protein K2M30_01970, partial [Desulfovibrionaceae bacterium]|nr:hypothetical protein [Desulfovibrionaceae bacterium]